jgi:uncharacterized protein with PIN domain
MFRTTTLPSHQVGANLYQRTGAVNPVSLKKDRTMTATFVADAMLGKLAKWLRMMGYDTHYQPSYSHKTMLLLVKEEGRILLTRNTRSTRRWEGALFIRSDHVGEQLRQMKMEAYLEVDRSKWFTRCSLCNRVLEEASFENVQGGVPEYVLFQNPSGIRFCPACQRFFWPGTHKERMIRQLEAWGL